MLLLATALHLGCLLATAAEAQQQVYFPQSPPSYPSPQGGRIIAPSWADAYSKAKALVAQMTLIEKVNVTTGSGWEMELCVGNTNPVPRLNFPSLCLQDSPLGVRDTDLVSAFPAGMNAAMTWDIGMMYARGFAMGAEHKTKGTNVQLGPVCGPLGRNTRGGRNWEGFSPDPYLSGLGMEYTIQGIQDAGTQACAKHFIGNEQEHFRQVGNGYNISASLSSNIDDRTMHELYLWPFANAVRASVASVMCSYNQINNSYACQNSKMMNGLLKEELGFQGYVVSDWSATQSGVASALAGLEMTMPGDGLSFSDGVSFFGRNLTTAVANGSLPIERLDDMATRIVAAWYKLGQDKNHTAPNFSAWSTATRGFKHFIAKLDFGVINEHVDAFSPHRELNRELAAQSHILLKNTGSLPLQNVRQLGLFGSDAGPAMYGPNGCPDRSCLNGTLAMGWGSGTDQFPYLVTPLEAIQARALTQGSSVLYVLDDYAYTQQNMTASYSDASIVFVAADSGEGYLTVDGNMGDRNNFSLWDAGDALVQNVAGSCNNTIVVIHSVGAVSLESWVQHPNVTAIVYAGLPGQESGNAIADILYGDVNPSGRLPFTIAKNLTDYGTSVLYTQGPNGSVPQVNFTEGVFIDYRHFDANNITPRYEFGFGLSYSTFNYTNLHVSKVTIFNALPPPPPTLLPAYSYNSTVPPPSQLGFPADFGRKIPNYEYAYLNHTNITTNASYPYPVGYSATPMDTPAAGGGEGGNPALWEVLYHANVTVTNTGMRGGADVPQLYIAYPQGDPQSPPKVLRGFAKVSVDANGSTTVNFDIMRRDISMWDVTMQNWRIPSGDFTVMVGSSSRNLPLTSTFTV